MRFWSLRNTSISLSVMRVERQRRAGLGDDRVHHVPQADAAGVVLHPARLEGGVLAAVGEDDQLLVALRGGVDHRLGEDVNVGDGDRLDLAGRLDRPARRSGTRACCTTGRPTGRAEDDQRQERLLVAAAIGQAAVGEGSRCIAPHWRQNQALGQRAERGGRPAVGLLQEPVGQDQPGAGPGG